MICLPSHAGMYSLFVQLGFRLQAFLFRGTTLKYRDSGVVRRCVKGGADKIRMPAPTVLSPRPAQMPEHTSVAMKPAVVLRQALVFWPAWGFILGLPCLLPWGLWGLTASFGNVPASLPQLLGLWAPV